MDSEDGNNELLQQILNNITNKLDHEGEVYFLLVKKQRSGNHCLLYLTDLTDNIWIKKLTPQYLADLSTKLKIQTEVKKFIQYLAFGLKQQCFIKRMDPYPTLNIKLKISDGLAMSSMITLDTNINPQNHQSKFKQIIRVFGKQFYEAWENKCKQAVKQVIEQQKYRQAMTSNKNNVKQQDIKLANKIFTKPPQAKVIPEKYRDLINPTRKKRTGKGMKLSVPQPELSDQSQSI